MENPVSDPLKWYCVRSKPKRQHVASTHLRTLGVEVFNPQLRYQRSTRRGPAWSTAPLFPNYVFARFDVTQSYRMVKYAFGVHDVLRFGERWAEIPEAEITALRQTWNQAEAIQAEQTIEVGSQVVLTGGLFHGVEVTVLALIPARERVKVLIEFLGGLQEAEVDAAAVLPPVSHPLAR